jgi:hypothetical protein
LDEELTYENRAAAQYGYSESPGMQAGMERLGKIPNDLGITGGVTVAPARSGR